MKPLNYLTKENINFILKLFVEIFLEKLNVFVEIFGISFAVAVILAGALLIILKYPVYFLLFIAGAVASAALLNKLGALYQLVKKQLKKALTEVGNWLLSFSNHSHHH